MKPLLDFFGKQRKSNVLATALVLSAAVGVLDHLTGAELAFSIFYLLPVSIAAWFVSRDAGILLSVVCAVIWFLADRAAGAGYSQPLILVWNVAAGFGFFLIFAILLAVLKRDLIRQSELARTDSLTGAANVRGFLESVSTEIDRATRYRHPLTLVYLDVDHFKAVNDRFGHGTGDMLLQMIVGTIRKCVRSTDVVGRLGGDEFAILFPETGYQAGEVAVDRVAENLRSLVRGSGWPVTFSLGAVSCTGMSSAWSVDEVIRKADWLMYQAKGNGKNQIVHQLFDGTTALPLTS